MLKNQKGYSIIELAVVISVILILVALSVGVYAAIEERAEYAAVRAKLQKIADGITMYKADISAYPSTNQLETLADKEKITNATTAKFWKGPYLPQTYDFDASGLVVHSECLKFSWGSAAGTAGGFGRTTAGGRDYYVRAIAASTDASCSATFDRLEKIQEDLGDKVSKYDSSTKELQYRFNYTY
jgi:prepilin-type N-terminal cleavage/methylation domain-containing protein